MPTRLSMFGVGRGRAGLHQGAHERGKTRHPGPFEVAEQVGRGHRRPAFLTGEPDDGRGDLVGELAEKAAQVGVRVGDRDPELCEPGSGEIGQVVRDRVVRRFPQD